MPDLIGSDLFQCNSIDIQSLCDTHLYLKRKFWKSITITNPVCDSRPN